MKEKSLVSVNENAQQLIKEIGQIQEQYNQEVPTKRRPWPESIQSRILALWRLGVSSGEIAKETGLPAQTLYSWRQRIKKKEPNFLQVPIVKKRHRRTKIELQLSRLESEVKSPTVIVVIYDGVRIEGIPISQVATVVREIRHI